MRNSRYLWIVFVVALSFVGIASLKTPENIISALANPGYTDSPRATVQHFWNLIDNRQVNLARDMLITPESPQLKDTLDFWDYTVKTNSFLSLQKVEFLDLRDPQAIIVRVHWNSPPDQVETATYRFDILQSEQRWLIKNIENVDEISFARRS